MNSNQPNGINKNEHPGGEISIFVKIIFWPYFLIKHIVHFFGFDAETPSPPRSPMYLNSPKFIQVTYFNILEEYPDSSHELFFNFFKKNKTFYIKFNFQAVQLLKSIKNGRFNF